MKLISWNVNGLRACVKKGFADFFLIENADFFSIQETKLQPEQMEETKFFPEGYEIILHSAERKGYSGTAIYTKHQPISIQKDFGTEQFSDEGRVITLEYEKFYLVNAYVPNSKNELLRLSYRQEWEEQLRKHLVSLDQKKPVIYCGDLNVAHQEIDLEHPDANHMNPGFSDEERACMTKLLESGFTDTFRFLYPNMTKAYTWWSYRASARQKNVGWRIDYFLVSNRIADKIQKAEILTQILGSDHCPVLLEIDL